MGTYVMVTLILAPLSRNTEFLSLLEHALVMDIAHVSPIEQVFDIALCVFDVVVHKLLSSVRFGVRSCSRGLLCHLLGADKWWSS